MSPLTDPAAASNDATRQKPLRPCKKSPRHDDRETPVLTMYISIGKNTASGQNDIAPRSPTKSLKNGNIIATNVVNTTYELRHTTRNGLSLSFHHLYSLLSNLFPGHTRPHHASTAAKMGWQNTWYAPKRWMAMNKFAAKTSQYGS